MNAFRGSLVRAICSIIMGVLLVRSPYEATMWLIMVVGALFLIFGALSLVTYFVFRRKYIAFAPKEKKSRSMPVFPVAGCGSLLLGLLLLVNPQLVSGVITYILGAILVLGGLGQMFVLISAMRTFHIGWGFWLCPSITFLVGIIALIRPSWIASAPMLVIGWCLLLYGITDIINSLKIYSCYRRYEKSIQKTESSIDSDVEKQV